MVLLYCLQSGAISVSGPLFSGYMNAHIPSGYRATALSLINALATAYIAHMGLAIGRIAASSLPYAFVFMGGLVLAGALALRIEEQHIELGSD